MGYLVSFVAEADFPWVGCLVDFVVGVDFPKVGCLVGFWATDASAQTDIVASNRRNFVPILVNFMRN